MIKARSEEVIGQRLEPDRAVLACGVVEPDPWCRRCGCEGTSRDSVIRRLPHEPQGWRPTMLLVTIRRSRPSSSRRMKVVRPAALTLSTPSTAMSQQTFVYVKMMANR
jgi:hypothetical protein